jgi:hypothetical protein
MPDARLDLTLDLTLDPSSGSSKDLAGSRAMDGMLPVIWHNKLEASRATCINGGQKENLL